MRWFRRHRGSQTGDLAPVVRIAAFPKGADPADIARTFSYALDGRRPPGRLTARQVLTDTLAADAVLAGHLDRVPALADRLLLDLDEAGLSIVASGDVE